MAMAIRSLTTHIKLVSRFHLRVVVMRFMCCMTIRPCTTRSLRVDGLR